MDLEPYFRNCDFWMGAMTEKGVDFRNDIEFRSRQLAVRCLTDSNLEELVYIASKLLRYTFQAVSCVTGRFTAVHKLGAEVFDDEEARKKHHVKYFLRNCYIIDRETLKPVVIGHAHSSDALDSPDDLFLEVKHAEDYMRTILEEWVEHSLYKVLYGVIVIGGDTAFYQMDKETMTFSRIHSGKPVKVDSTPTLIQWMALDREDGLPELLGIFMKAWCEFDEDGMRKRVEQREKLRSNPTERQRTISGESSSSSKASTKSETWSSSTSSTVSDVGSRETSPDKENAGSYPEKMETAVYVY